MDIEEQYDKIYRYSYMHTHHQQTAEDITQETFLRFLNDHSYKERGKPLAYLYTIARNLCTDFYRKKKSVPFEWEGIEDENRGVPYFAAESQEDQIIQGLSLKRAVETLGKESRELIFLRYVNDLSVTDIGRILDISRFVVHRRLNTCLKQLKEQLGEEEFF